MPPPTGIITAMRPPLPGEPETPPQETFLPIDLDGLVVDTVLDFNLFLPAGKGRLLFFRSPNLEFSVVHRNRLIDNNVHTVYIRAQERGRYNQYLEHHLPAVIASPDVAPDARRPASCTPSRRNVVQDCLTDPRSDAIVPRTQACAESTIDFVLKSDRSLGQLATIMATDYYTYTHSINVSVFAVALAHKAGVPKEDLAESHDGGDAARHREVADPQGDCSSRRARSTPTSTARCSSTWSWASACWPLTAR